MDNPGQGLQAVPNLLCYIDLHDNDCLWLQFHNQSFDSNHGLSLFSMEYEVPVARAAEIRNGAFSVRLDPKEPEGVLTGVNTRTSVPRPVKIDDFGALPLPLPVPRLVGTRTSG